jgi:hypothetical protein
MGNSLDSGEDGIYLHILLRDPRCIMWDGRKVTQIPCGRQINMQGNAVLGERRSKP